MNITTRSSTTRAPIFLYLPYGPNGGNNDFEIRSVMSLTGGRVDELPEYDVNDLSGCRHFFVKVKIKL